MNRRIPIVFITGHGDVPTSVRAMKAGAVEFLTKPFGERISSTPSAKPSTAIRSPVGCTPSCRSCANGTPL